METLRVLICDDEPGMRQGVARALRDYIPSILSVESEVRFDVEQAESGEAALSIIHQRPPDILLLDHKLPGISGLDVLDEIAETGLDMLVIMISAYASIETAVRATKKGSYDYLPKPFTPMDLKNTVLKAAEHLLLTRHARKLAHERRQVRFQFISVLAHELKAPLNAVEGYLNLLKDHTVGDDPAVYHQVIERCANRTSYMRKMINDLLDLTRIESGQKRREFEPVDLRETAQIALDSVKPEADARCILLRLHATVPVTLNADRGEMEIMLNNLVTNAVKYNRDHGTVEVSIEDRDREAVVTVADTGIGMTQEETARLFTDFFRVKNDKTRDILGSGLGLSIVKKLATLYGGAVRVASKPDEGSTFTVTLKKNARPEEGAHILEESSSPITLL